MKRRFSILLIVLILPAFSSTLLAHSFTGTVSRVIDGDTIIVNPVDPVDPVKKGLSVRLAEIDAPELDQDYGKEAKKALAELVLNKEVTIEYSKKDFFGRIIARIYLPDHKEGVNAILVKKGHAWWYEKYSDDERLNELKEAAKTAKRGLWAANAVVAPWVFRRRK